MAPETTPDVIRVLRGAAAALAALTEDGEIRSVSVKASAYDVELRVEASRGADFRLPVDTRDRSAIDIAHHLFTELQDWIAELPLSWGAARPVCPGHAHPRELVRTDDTLQWRCPADESARHGDMSHLVVAFPELNQ
ncbi:MAG: hypothetical protein ACRDVE_17530 [Actinocrinis sp.]